MNHERQAPQNALEHDRLGSVIELGIVRVDATPAHRSLKLATRPAKRSATASNCRASRKTDPSHTKRGLSTPQATLDSPRAVAATASVGLTLDPTVAPCGIVVDR